MMFEIRHEQRRVTNTLDILRIPSVPRLLTRASSQTESSAAAQELELRLPEP